jgi:hypothetical protein
MKPYMIRVPLTAPAPLDVHTQLTIKRFIQRVLEDRNSPLPATVKVDAVELVETCPCCDATIVLGCACTWDETADGPICTEHTEDT